MIVDKNTSLTARQKHTSWSYLTYKDIQGAFDDSKTIKPDIDKFTKNSEYVGCFYLVDSVSTAKKLARRLSKIYKVSVKRDDNRFLNMSLKTGTPYTRETSEKSNVIITKTDDLYFIYFTREAIGVYGESTTRFDRVIKDTCDSICIKCDESVTEASSCHLMFRLYKEHGVRYEMICRECEEKHFQNTTRDDLLGLIKVVSDG